MKRFQCVMTALVLALNPVVQAGAAELGPPLSHAEALEAGLISEADARELFQLWNKCRPIGFELKLYGGKSLGLTRDTIKTLVRDRLKAARLYTENYEPPEKRLEMLVRVGGPANPAFSYLMLFIKRMKDEETGLHLDATGWLKDAFGAHQGERAVVLFHISQALDKFIDEYLRVNDTECGKPQERTPRLIPLDDDDPFGEKQKPTRPAPN